MWQAAAPLIYSGTGGVALGQTGNFDIVGSATFSSAISGSAFGINMTGGGNLTLSGANNYTGNTTVTSGTLTLSGSLSPSSQLVMGGGTFNYAPGTTGNSQTVNGLRVNGGASAISVNANNVLVLGAITRNTGGTAVFTEGNAAATAGNSTNGITTTNSVGNSTDEPDRIISARGQLCSIPGTAPRPTTVRAATRMPQLAGATCWLTRERRP